MGTQTDGCGHFYRHMTPQAPVRMWTLMVGQDVLAPARPETIFSFYNLSHRRHWQYACYRRAFKHSQPLFSPLFYLEEHKKHTNNFVLPIAPMSVLLWTEPAVDRACCGPSLLCFEPAVESQGGVRWRGVTFHHDDLVH